MSATLLREGLGDVVRDLERRLAVLERAGPATALAPTVTVTARSLLVDNTAANGGTSSARALFVNSTNRAVEISGFLDFHLGGHADEATDYNVRLTNDAAGQLSLVGGNLRLAAGSLLLNSGGITMTGQIWMTSGWFRSQTWGQGWYHELGGGGWMMSDTLWLRAYGDKGIYSAGEFQSGLHFNARGICYMGASGAHGTGWAQFSHWNYRASSLHYGFMHNGGEALVSADVVQLRYQNSWRLEVSNTGVRTNGVYLSTRGASVYLKWDGDNTHRIWHNATTDAVHITSWSSVAMEAAAHDHMTRCEAQTRHVNRANNAWRYSDAAGHTNFSDPRGKRDMVPLGAALGPQRQKLKAIAPIRFKFREDRADPEGDRDHIGFNGDELPPEVIHLREMSDGRVDKLFDPAGVLALLWQITRELDDATEARIAAAEERMARNEARITTLERGRPT